MERYLIIVIGIILITVILMYRNMKKEDFRFRVGYYCPTCSNLKTFAQCFECENCVWCPLCKKCIPGDSYGPYKKCCKYWKHRGDFHNVAGCRTVIKPFR